MEEYEDYIIYHFEQKSEEWFNIRKNKITGSKFGDIIYQKFNNHENLSKMIKGELEPSFNEIQIQNMKNGIENEPIARKKYEELNNCKVKEIGILISKKYNFLGFSPDGLVGNDGMIEIKCPYKIYYPLLKEGKIWDSHIAQIQGGLFLCKRKWCDYVVYGHSNQEIYIKKIYYDEKYCNEILLPSLLNFYEKYLKV